VFHFISAAFCRYTVLARRRLEDGARGVERISNDLEK
jgi:hypothetical protein